MPGTAARAAGSLEILPLSQVKEGQKGWGLTVISGEKPERFEVEVLGVVPNTLPGRSNILVRLSGLGLESSGVSAGMSGSPVYVDGRLIGAVSAMYPFSKEPLGIVTPIESMLDVDPAAVLPGAMAAGKGPAPASPTAEAGHARRLPGNSSLTWERVLELLALAPDERVDAMRRELLATLPPRPSGPSLLAPTAVGISTDSLGRYPELFDRLGLASPLPAAVLPAFGGTGGGSGARPALSTPPASGPVGDGGAITALLIDGDFQFGATGTVTRVEPDGRFFAFGHPFLNMGPLELPVAPARVVSVVSSVYQSFKVAYPLKAAYRLTFDRDTAITGRLDRTVSLVPLRLTLSAEGAEPKALNVGVSPHPRLLPTLVALVADASMNRFDPTPRDRTLAYRVSVTTSAGPIVYEDRATGPRAREVAVLTSALLTSLVVDNDMSDPQISGIDIALRSEPGERRLRIVDAGLSRRHVEPGGTVSAVVRLADRRGDEQTRVLSLTVPRDAPEGKATFVVSDGSNASGLRMTLSPAEPRTLSDFARFVDRLVPSDRLYAAIVVPSRGIATGSETLASVPPTFAALLAAGLSDRPEQDRVGVGGRVLAERVEKLDRPLAGMIRLELEVERPRS